MEEWSSGAVEGAIMRSTDLLLQFPPVRRLDFSFAKVGSIRAFDIGTMDNARDAVHCSTVQLFLTGISVLKGIGPHHILSCIIVSCSELALLPSKQTGQYSNLPVALVNHGERL